MDFNDTAEEAKFRKEASDWLSANAEKKEHSRDVYPSRRNDWRRW